MKRLLVVVLPWLLTIVPGLAAEDTSEAPSVLVAVVPARQGTLDMKLTAYGEIMPAPGAALNISVQHAGQVVRLPLATGQLVRKGDALFDFSAEPTAVLAYRQAVSTLTLARQEQSHVAALFAQKLATHSQLDQADKAVRDAEAELEAQRRQGGDRSAETVVAPFTGIVSALAAANGDHVQANATIVQLVPNDRLVAVLGIQPEYGTRLASGMTVQLAATARSAKPVDGKLLTVGGATDPKTQMIDATVSVSLGESLFLGEHVAAVISTGTISGWVVPRQAVLSDKDGSYLFQIADGKAKRVGVSIVGESGDEIAVDGPVDPQSRIVFTGNYQLSEGMAVRPASGAAPDADQAK